MREQLQNFIDTFGKKFLQGFIVVFSGQTLTSILNMITMLIFINTLGSIVYGEFVMVQASTTLVYSIFSFKGFQSLVHFLNRNANQDKTISMGYIKSVVILDIISLFLSIVICFFFTDTLCQIMNWDKKMSYLIKIFTITLFTNFSGTTTGVIYTFQKYSYLVNGQILATIFKVILYLVSSVMGNYSLLNFVLIETLYITLSNVITLIYTYKIMKENGLETFYLAKANWSSEFIKFNISSNITSTIDLPVNQIATFIINKFLGFEFNAVYSVFEKLGAILNKVITPLGQLIYPEISKKISEGDIKGGFKLVKNSKILIYSLFLCVAIFIILTYKIWFKYFLPDGNQYIFAFILYIFYICYTGATSAVHSIFISLGYINYTPFITISVNIVYLILLLLLINYLGLIGVILAFLLQAMAIIIIKNIILKRRGNDYA